MQNQHAVLYLHLKDTGSIAHSKMKAAVSIVVNSLHLFCLQVLFCLGYPLLYYKNIQQVIISHKTENLIFDNEKSE